MITEEAKFRKDNFSFEEMKEIGKVISKIKQNRIKIE